ncbi:MAG: cytochrome c oxidase subunit 3 [Burkholderiaceae bacterium]|jgi:cytochrome c oxidase subunit 3|nr:cytochrome c oxidase subunit 3 [Burkholderiaceae bacterium]
MPLTAAAIAEPRSIADDRVPGYTGMWVGITAELFEFTVFFVVYFAARWSYPAVFRASAPKLWTLGGLLITLVMLSSGYLLLRTVQAARRDDQRAARVWISAAFVVALGYPLLKYLEIQWNFSHGVVAGGNAFFSVYYYLTINHLVHSAWGILGMAWVLLRVWQGAYRPGQLKGVESMAIYWHATDLVWLMLFSLFYAFV